MQQAFFFSLSLFAGFTVYHVKTCTSFGSSYGRGEDMSSDKSRAHFFHCIILPLLRHPPAFSYVLGNPIFFAVRSGWKQAKHQLLSALPK